MRRSLRGGLVVLVAAAAAGSGVFLGLRTKAAPAFQVTRKVLSVDLRPQEKPNWCWAATSQMTMEFDHRNGTQDVSQCQQVSKKLSLGAGGCCSSSQDCDVTGWPIFTQFNFTATSTSSQELSWDDVRAEIDAGRPFCFTLKWTESALNTASGHMVLVRGYEIDAQNQRWVHVIDPLPVPEPGNPIPALARGGDTLMIRYEDYVGNPTPGAVNERWSGYTHWNDYFNVKPAGSP
ncbi:MAG: C39 family peptidase [Isosphaeraceae bacterium]